MLPLLPFELRPEPGPAREWLRAELAGKDYQPSPVERFTDWFWGLLEDLVDGAQNLGTLSTPAALGLLLLVVGLLTFALSRLRRDPRSRVAARPLLEDTGVTAAEHRARAHRALAEERWDDAVVDGVRALALTLVERDLVEDQPAATAREVAAAAARVFDSRSAELLAAARLFEDVRYGDRHADREAAARLLELEAALQHLRPGAAGASTGMAVPR